MMTANYKEMFNTKLKEKVKLKETNYKQAKKVREDIEELYEILKDIVEELEGVETEYRQADDEVLVEGSSIIKVKLHTDELMRVVVSKQRVSFDRVGAVEVNDNILEEYVIDTVYDKVVYDKGANHQEKKQVFEYVIEAIADMVAEG